MRVAFIETWGERNVYVENCVPAEELERFLRSRYPHRKVRIIAGSEVVPKGYAPDTSVFEDVKLGVVILSEKAQRTVLQPQDCVSVSRAVLRPVQREDGTWDWRVVSIHGPAFLNDKMCSPMIGGIADTCGELLYDEQEEA